MAAAQWTAGRDQSALNHNPPNSLLTTQPPEFTTGQACEIAHAHYDIDVSAKSLWSERDQNFQLCSESGEQYVLKIANALEDPGVLDFQTQALTHIARVDPTLPVPRTIANRDHQNHSLVQDDSGRNHMVRLISWLDGKILEEADMNSRLLRETGQVLARLGIALKGFSHPASVHHLLWDLKNAADLLELLPNIDEPALRQRIEKALERFIQNVQPALASLRSQVIHADLNRGNVLVSTEGPERVSGIIDFGDMVHTPLIMDLAIAAAYHLKDSGDPLASALHMILGYHQVTPLRAVEADILLELMTARLCTSITVQIWRAKLYPRNSEYLLIHNRFSRDTLKHISSCNTNELRQRIMVACGHA